MDVLPIFEDDVGFDIEEEAAFAPPAPCFEGFCVRHELRNTS
jgi:hypothetical protein